MALRVALKLLYLFWVLKVVASSIVLDFPNQEPVSLTLENDVQIKDINSFCVKYYWTATSNKHGRFMFASENDSRGLGLKMYMNRGLAFFNKNGLNLLCKIPEKCLRPYTWNHLCFSFAGDLGYQIACEGQIWSLDRTNLVQTEDNTLKRLSFDWSGHLAEFNIWSKTLSIEEMVEITSSCNNPLQDQEDLLPWSKVTKSKIDGFFHEENLCSQSENKTSLVQQFQPIKMGIKLCSLMGGKAITPEPSDPMFQDWPSKVCGPDKRLAAPFQQIENGSWIDVHNGNVVDLTSLWKPSQPNGVGLQPCTTSSNGSKQLTDDECEFECCHACSWNSNPFLQLRGLCSTSDIDRDYILLPGKEYNDQVVFMGFTTNMIIFSKTWKNWVIVKGSNTSLSEEKMEMVGNCTSKANAIPLGASTWDFLDCSQSWNVKLTMVSIDLDNFICSKNLVIVSG